MQFVALDAQVEVNGETVSSVLAGMGSAKALATRLLSKNGIDNPMPGQWYPQQRWLDAFKDIADSIGPNTLFQIGQSIPKAAQFPPELKALEQALAAIDVAYHMNHRLKGIPLFDAKSGAMREGIGHYTFTSLGPRKGKVVCANPYPCDFDRGIIEAMANRFKRRDVGLPQEGRRVLHLPLVLVRCPGEVRRRGALVPRRSALASPPQGEERQQGAPEAGAGHAAAP